MSLVVLGGSVSPFVRKVRVALAEKGLEYRHEQVNPYAPPAGWRELSPLGKIPAFRDGDRALADSSVICAYLERRFPQPALYPSDPYDYARALWFEEYMDSGFVPVAGARVFFPLVLKPLFGGKAEADPNDVAAASKVVEEELPGFWDYLERELADHEFIVGDRFTIADIAIASPHANLRHAGVAPVRKRWPRLRAFLDRMHGRSSFKKVMEEETPVFGKRSIQIND
ncbi:MAG TPA: glutathione S-transferase family protein [Deltaproteobacteria bacterium]|jgi:glutathione S-transferase|nr:glutathione S-transferase family protein [Deltaproteobacteria bacterium]